MAYLVDRAPKAAGVAWRGTADAAVALCAPSAGPVGRAALLTRAPTRFELDRCSQALGREPEIAVLGYEAVAIVGRLGDVLIPLDAGKLFRGIAREVPGSNGPPAPNVAKQWKDIDPALPAVPIAVLIPAPGSAAWRVFAGSILDLGCLQVLGTRVPFDATRRAETCGAMRGDGAVTVAEGDDDRVARLRGGEGGTLAVVAQVALRNAGIEVNVMPLSGQLPTAATIAAAAYPASRPVYLAYVVPRAGGGAIPQSQRALGEALQSLVAEDSIGPYGAMAAAGLVPLIPAERVALRERIGDQLGGAQ